jgi:DNA polymerase III delta prime subunit
MIKLFRNIRKNLLQEGKTANYLKYAIGEIVLVVIGILIALQINNWNEKKKINQSIAEHLIILKQNLLEDRLQLEVLHQNMSDNFNYSDSLMLQFKTLTQIDNKTTKYLGKLLLEYRFRPNKNAIETITQSNEIPFLDSQLQKEILDYYALIESASEREQIANNQIQSKYENYINFNYPQVFQKNSEWDFVKDFYKDDPRPIVIINKEAFLSDKKLESLVTSRYFQSNSLKKFYSELIDSCNTILTTLEAKI